MRVQVTPLTEKGKMILQQNTNKFGINHWSANVVKRVGDRYTTTEIIPNPFTITIVVKSEFNKYINKDVIYDKTRLAVEKILQEHNGSIHDVNIEVYDD